MLGAVAVCALVIAVGQRASWAVAIVFSVSVLLAGYAVTLRLLEPIPAGLAEKNAVLLTLVAALAIVRVARSTPLRLPPLRSTLALCTATLPVVALSAGALVTVAVGAGERLVWSMQNDAIWNTMVARFLWEDGGVAVDRPNVSPLVSGLLAGAFAPGRAATAPLGLLEHDLVRQAELWILLVAATGILAAVVAWRELPRLSTTGRAAAALAVSLVPVSPYVAGYSFQFGFYNAIVVVLLLLCGWMLFREADRYRVLGVIGMAATSIALLAVWAPLAAVPLALGVLLLITTPRSWWASLARRELTAVIVSLASIPAYLLAVTVPDVLRDNGALSAEGATVGVQPVFVALVLTGMLGVAVVRSRFDWRSTEVWGTAAVLAASAVVLAYLMLQRRAFGYWGYYPAKFAWLLVVFAIIVSSVWLIAIVSRARSLPLRGVGVVAVVTVVVSVMVTPLPTPGSLRSWSGAYLGTAMPVSSDAVRELFALSDPDQLTVVSRDLGADQDRFINGWLIQQSASSARDPIRSFAYDFDSGDAAEVCRLADEAPGPIMVATRDPGLAVELDALCSDADVSVVDR